MNSLKNTFEYLLDFIFPKSELLKKIESLTSGELLNLLPHSREIDEKNTIILFDYRDKVVKDLIWEIKYKGNMKIASKLAEILFDIIQVEVAERALFENFINPLLIPMPTSDKRRRERGYNQTEIICEEIMKLDSQNLLEYNPRQLEKSVFTESQARTHATKREREANLLNSINVSNALGIKGRCIILIDDVLTSGATFNEAKRALKGADARKIICVALAH